MDVTDLVRDFYNAEVEAEWIRIENRPEFLLTCRYIKRHVKPGDKVLDIGGGPGRYSLWLAEMGCDVTLLDLSPENIRYAKVKAAESGLSLTALDGDARRVDSLVNGPFDHILLMGPLYHLLKEDERIQTINASLRLLRPGGILFASFINVFAGVIYAMKFAPETILDQSDAGFYQTILADTNYAGPAFTQAFFIKQNEVLPFMKQFPLEKLHFFGQEGITSPCENNIMSQPPEVVGAWLDLSEQLAEREELLSWSEHLMYVGRKL